MKRTLLNILLILALLFSTISCGAKTEDSPYTDEDFDTSGDIVLRIEHPVYDKSVTSFRYYVENHTGEELTFGSPYAIEVKKDGVWQSLPMAEDAAWNDIAYILEPGGEWSNAFSFFAYDYEVTDGQYRLIKEIAGKRYFAEFTIGVSDITGENPFGYEALEELPKNLDLGTLEYDLMIDAAGKVAGGSEEAVAEFLRQVALGDPAMLRMVCMGISGEAVLYDIIYQDNHFLCRRDATRSNTNAVIEERRYAFIVTDGECVYLSDVASLQEEDMAGRSISAGRYTILKEEWFADWEGIVTAVEDITKAHLEGSVVLARFWSDNGDYWLDLTGEGMDYLVSTRGYGMGRTLTECVSEEELEIVGVRWESATQVRLLCLPVDADESGREPGWYAVFDVTEEKISSNGRSMWQSNFSGSGTVEEAG